MSFSKVAWGQDQTFDSNNFPLPKSEAEKKILGVLADINRGPAMANVATLHGRLLRIFTEAVKAKNVVEIGTSKAIQPSGSV